MIDKHQDLTHPDFKIHFVNSISEVFNNEHFNPANVIAFKRTVTHDFNLLANAIYYTDHRYVWHYSALKAPQFCITKNNLEQLKEKVTEKEEEEDLHKQIDFVLRDMEQVSDRRRVLLIAMKDHTSHNNKDVYEFHTDGCYPDFGRVMCCYTNPRTEGIPVIDASREHPEAPKDSVQGSRYTTKREDRVFTFPTATFWRHLGIDNDYNVPAFIHRAQINSKHTGPRLMLFAD